MLNFPFVLEAIRNSRMMFDNISAVLILKSIGQILVQYLLCTFSINWWELEIVRIDFVDWILGRLLHWMDINCIDIAIKWSSVCNVSGQTASVNNVQWIWISVSLGKWFEDTGLITEFNGWTKWTRSAHSIPFVPLSLSLIPIKVAWKCQLWEISMCQYNEWKFHFPCFHGAISGSTAGYANANHTVSMLIAVHQTLYTDRIPNICVKMSTLSATWIFNWYILLLI